MTRSTIHILLILVFSSCQQEEKASAIVQINNQEFHEKTDCTGLLNSTKLLIESVFTPPKNYWHQQFPQQPKIPCHILEGLQEEISADSIKLELFKCLDSTYSCSSWEALDQMVVDSSFFCVSAATYHWNPDVRSNALIRLRVFEQRVSISDLMEIANANKSGPREGGENLVVHESFLRELGKTIDLVLNDSIRFGQPGSAATNFEEAITKWNKNTKMHITKPKLH